MRRALTAAAVALALAACDGHGKKDTAATSATRRPVPSFAHAEATTLGLRTARLTQTTTIVIGGSEVKAYDTGRVAFDGSRAHIYKLDPGGQFPGEVIVIGPYTYTNANVQASLQTPSVRPWTKLDTRKVSARAATNQTDELSHVLAPAYLALGAATFTVERSVADGAVFGARVDPKLVLRRVPAARRAKISKAIRADYPASAFNARFWIDRRDRIRRVIVAWTTSTGTPVAIDTSYGAFGKPVDTRLPRADRIKDITPES